MNRGIVREDEDYIPEPGDTFRIDIRDYWGGREGGEKEKKRIGALGVLLRLYCSAFRDKVILLKIYCQYDVLFPFI